MHVAGIKPPRQKSVESISLSARASYPDTYARSAQHAAGNLDNLMLRLFARRQRASMSAYFTNVDTANRPWPTSVDLAAGSFPVGQRVARSLPERWPAVLLRGIVAVQGHRLALEGQPGRCPFLIRSGNGRQDARPALLTALSLFFAGVAWSSDYLVLSSVFFVLGGVAAVEIVWNH